MVDTREVASHLQTDPKILRRFLRSNACTIKPVGSGGRYTFSKADLEELERGFRDWSKGKNVKPVIPGPRVSLEADDQEARDRAVWAEEEARRGPLVLEDIRDPDVRRRVREKAAAQEARLNARLLAVGLHVTQWRNR